MLLRSFGAPVSEEAAQAHVHGFHSYPARMHPTVARRAIEELCPVGGTVLDPFCGSGTVLIEARLLGRSAFGSDLNPLAVLLAATKVRGANRAELQRLERACVRVVDIASARRVERAGASRRYSAIDVRRYDPHVLLELDGLLKGIEGLERGIAHQALQLVLSSILTKVSRQPGDTAGRWVEARRLAGGHVIRVFSKKASELGDRLAQYTESLPARSQPAVVQTADARSLVTRDDSIDLVVTSPPYPGNYDYLYHHAARLRWLGLDAAGLRRQEIGARRNSQSVGVDETLGRFDRDFRACLFEMKRVMRSGAHALLVMADSVVQTRVVRGDEWVERLAREAGLETLAVASQSRPHFHQPTARIYGRQPRPEHGILLRKPVESSPARSSKPRR